MSETTANTPRRRRGAKRLPEEVRRSERVSALLTLAEKAALEAEADRRGISLAEIVREALVSRARGDASLAHAS